MSADLYSFAFRGLLAEEALDKAGRKRYSTGVAVHKTGFEKQILWQLPDKGC